MGLKYDSAESSAIMGVLEHDLTIARQAVSGLQTGTQHLITGLTSGSLQGVAYNAGRELFAGLVEPTESKVAQALDDVNSDLNAYKQANSLIAHYGVLDEDNLNSQINEKQTQQFATQALLDIYYVTMVSNPVVAISDLFTGYSHQLDNISQALSDDIDKLQEKLKALYQFSDQTSPLFKDNLNVLNIAMRGVTSLNNMQLITDGTIPTSYNSTWLKSLENITLNSQLGTIEQHSTNGTDYRAEFENKVNDVGEWSKEALSGGLDSIKDTIITEGKNIGKSFGAMLQPRDSLGRFVADDFAPRKWLSNALKGIADSTSTVIGHAAKVGGVALVAVGAYENYKDYDDEYHNTGRAVAYGVAATGAGIAAGWVGSAVGGLVACAFADTALATVAAVGLPVVGAVVAGAAVTVGVKALYDNCEPFKNVINSAGDAVNNVGKAFGGSLKSVSGAFGW
jgi:hypothetical protein